MARVIAPGYPHHVTQRGNRRQQTFFGEEDYAAYVELLRERCDRYDVQVWGWCLLPNHVHLILVPRNEAGLRHAVGKTHRHYTRRVNFREGWRGHLWQGRFASFPMDDEHLWQAARYVDLNPVRARLVHSPEEWRWSSARARLLGVEDPLVSADCPLLLARETNDWREFLDQALSDAELASLRSHERTGRPLGSESFVRRLGEELGRDLLPGKPGRKPTRVGK